ncbi:hypothetical protein K1719_026948 [Acacia pycnantha]|nr:hypothetical protein K1719_026948 [Acacia pycnantha]
MMIPPSASSMESPLRDLSLVPNGSSNSSGSPLNTVTRRWRPENVRLRRRGRAATVSTILMDPTRMPHVSSSSCYSLNDNQLVGEIPVELGRLEHLFQLNLANKHLDS